MTKSASSIDGVLGVAGRLFHERGYERTTLRDIAAAAHILPGSLHYRFQSKDALLRSLMERGMNRALAEVRDAIAVSRNPVERLRLAARAHLRLLLAGDHAVFVLLYDFRSLTGPDRAAIVALRDAYEALWSGLLFAAMGAGAIREDVDLRAVRHALLGAINWTAQWYRPGGEKSSDEIADGYVSMMLDGIATRDDPRA